MNAAFTDYPGIRKRPKWEPKPETPYRKADWQSLLEMKELFCVVGDQMIAHARTEGEAWPEAHSLGAGPTKNEGFHYTSGAVQPGLECVEFYPLAKGEVHGGEFDVLPATLSFFDRDGRKVEVCNDLNARRWRPDLQEDVFRFEGGAFRQTIACADNIMICTITPLEGKLPARFVLSSDFGGTAGIVQVERGLDDMRIWGQETDWSRTSFGLWCGQPLESAEASAPGEAISYRLEGVCGDKIVLAYTVDYLMNDVQTRLSAAMSDPEGVYGKSTRFWDAYFGENVPYFHCSDLSYVKQYYYTFFCLRANVWDVPVEPLHYPYTCTSKLIWKWSWPWNSLFDNVTLRWMNDKSLAEGNVLLQFYLGCSMMEDPVLGKFPDLLPRGDADTFPIAHGDLTTNTSSYDAIWMTYLVTRNKAWLAKLYPAMVRHYNLLLERCGESGLPPWGLDEWDISARVRAFRPDALVDSACFLLSATRNLAKMAGELGDAGEKRRLEEHASSLREKIESLLWDDERKLFMDANVKEGTFSSIKTAAAFDPLYCGAASAGQAEHLVRHLTDPAEFWTPYPIPAFSIDSPEFRADADNIGNGPIPPISCGWFQIEGLVDYGYRDIAAELIRRQMAMNTLNGVSSAVKFNPLTGEGLQFFVSRKEDHSLCTMNATIVDLVIRYAAGFRPREDDLIEFDSLLLPESGWEQLSWGPYRYRSHLVSVSWEKDGGMTIACDDAVFKCGETRRVLLAYKDGQLRECGGPAGTGTEGEG